MELVNILVLGLAIVGLTEAGKRLVTQAGHPNLLGGWKTQILSAALAIGVLFLLADNLLKGQALVGSVPVDGLTEWATVLTGAFVGLVANLEDRFLATVAQIGSTNEDVPR